MHIICFKSGGVYLDITHSPKINKSQDSNKWKFPFFSMILAQAISMVGSSAVEFALIWWLTKASESSIILTIAGVFSFLPQALIGPFAGVWVDRFSRKKVIIISDLAVAFATTVLSFIFIVHGDTPYWIAFLVLSIHSFATAFHVPAVQATVSLLAPKDELVKANSYNELLQTCSFLIAPTIGAALFSKFPMYFVLLTDLVGAIIACSIVLFIHIPELKHSRNITNRAFFKDLAIGSHYYSSNIPLRSYTISLFIAMIFYMPLGMLFPLMVAKVFGGNAWFSGASQTLYTVGMLAAAILTGIIGKRLTNKLHTSRIGILIFALSLIISGFLPHSIFGLYIFISLCLFMGFGVNLSNIPYISYIQENVNKNVQGRVLSLFNTLNSIAMPIGLLLAGPMSDKIGLPLWFSISGIVMFISISGSYIYSKSRLEKESSISK